ncbi:MAG: DUF4381 domain-containing protein [Gammaproteobacteria bacterium]|nr:DUF4381 domain-containing protein [Gammaproteobacteria bacterium]
MNNLELRDIHLPDAVSWWPPAIGWWVLLMAIFLLIALLLWLYKRAKQVTVRQQAQQQYKLIKDEYNNCNDKVWLSQQLAQLLRQVLLTIKPRSEVAKVTGLEWLEALASIHEKGNLSKNEADILFLAPYQVSADYDADKLLQVIETWVKTIPSRHKI